MPKETGLPKREELTDENLQKRRSLKFKEKNHRQGGASGKSTASHKGRMLEFVIPMLFDVVIESLRILHQSSFVTHFQVFSFVEIRANEIWS